MPLASRSIFDALYLVAIAGDGAYGYFIMPGGGGAPRFAFDDGDAVDVVRCSSIDFDCHSESSATDDMLRLPAYCSKTQVSKSRRRRKNARHNVGHASAVGLTDFPRRKPLKRH